MGQRGIVRKERPAKAPNCAAAAAVDPADRALAETATGKMSGYTRRGLEEKRTKAFMDKGDAGKQKAPWYYIIKEGRKTAGSGRVPAKLTGGQHAHSLLNSAKVPLPGSASSRCE